MCYSSKENKKQLKLAGTLMYYICTKWLGLNTWLSDLKRSNNNHGIYMLSVDSPLSYLSFSMTLVQFLWQTALLRKRMFQKCCPNSENIYLQFIWNYSEATASGFLEHQRYVCFIAWLSEIYKKEWIFLSRSSGVCDRRRFITWLEDPLEQVSTKVFNKKPFTNSPRMRLGWE